MSSLATFGPDCPGTVPEAITGAVPGGAFPGGRIMVYLAPRRRPPIGGELKTMPSTPPTESPDPSGDETLSLQIANQIINVANARMQDGAQPDEVAAGLRHAAANFSAFVNARHQDGGGGDPDNDPGLVVEEFARLLEYYLGRHHPKEEPGEGLKQLIEQVKRET